MSDPLDRYLELLREWGGRMNLVGSLEGSALAAHVADSLAAACALPRAAEVVDLGSGAGFPGLPVAIRRPELPVTLVEIRERRVSFLRHVVRELGLENCRVRRERIEDAPPRGFDVVLLRAVAPLRRAAEMGRPWARPGGEVWIWTREDPSHAPWQALGQIELGPRGAILRLPEAAVSCGTADGGSDRG